jgi:hypothetical protein
MAGPKLEITFASKAELDGARQYAAELERNIGKSKAMGQETAAMSAQLKTLKGSIAESEKALIPETQATEKGAVAKFKLKDAVKGLAFEFPVLARAIGFVSNPLTLLAAGLGIAASKFAEWHAKTQAVLAERGTLKSFSDTTRDLALHAAEFGRRAADFETGLRRIGAEAGTASGKVDSLNRAIDRAHQLSQSLRDLDLDLKLKKLDKDVAEGRMKPDKRAAEEARLRQEHAEQKAYSEEWALSNRASRESFAAFKTQDEIDAARKRMPDSDTVSKAERKHDVAQKAAGASQTKLDALAKTNQTKIAQLQKQRESAEKAAETQIAQDGQQTTEASMYLLYLNTEMDKLLSEIKTEKAKNTEVQKKADEAKAELKAITDSVTQITTDITEATKRKQAHEKKAQDAVDELKALQKYHDEALPKMKQMGEIGAGIEKFRADREQSEKDAEMYFREYQWAQENLPEGERQKYLQRFDTTPAKKKTPPAWPGRWPAQPPHPGYPPDRPASPGVPGSPGSRRGVDDVGGRARGFADAGIQDAAREVEVTGSQVIAGISELLEVNARYWDDLSRVVKQHTYKIGILDSRINNRS